MKCNVLNYISYFNQLIFDLFLGNSRREICKEEEGSKGEEGRGKIKEKYMFILRRCLSRPGKIK